MCPFPKKYWRIYTTKREINQKEDMGSKEKKNEITPHRRGMNEIPRMMVKGSFKRGLGYKPRK